MNRFRGRQPVLLVGYEPSRRKAAEKILNTLSKPADQYRISNLSQIGQVREAIDFSKVMSIDSDSVFRSLLVHIQRPNFKPQAALLHLFEESSEAFQMVISTSALNLVIEPLKSRCRTVIFKPGDFGVRVTDLTESGLSPAYAAQVADGLLKGYHTSAVPTDQDKSRVKVLVESLVSGDYFTAFQVMENNSEAFISALREYSLSKESFEHLNVILDTYQSSDDMVSIVGAVSNAVNSQYR